jgi:TonB family protein
MEGTVVMSAPAPPAAREPEGWPALAHFADDPATAAGASRPGAPGKSGPNAIPLPPKPTATAAMPPIEPPRKKSGAPIALIGGGAGLVLLTLAALAAVWFLRNRHADVSPVATPAPPSITVAAVTPTPPPPSPVVKGTLHVESDPAGAAVTLNGEPRGVTPLDIPDLFLGNHEVKVELKGYAPVTQTVVLSQESPSSELKLPLSKSAPVVGVADLLSTPSGALVKVDGAGVGQTPLLNFSMKAGKHQVEMLKEGFEPWSESVSVGKRKARVDAALRAIPKATPLPVVADVPDPSKTYEQADVDTPPRQVVGSSASYPKDAPRLKSGQSVSVGGTFVVTVNGDVEQIQIRESGGRALDDAVMAAVAKRKYSPGVKKGVKVRVRVPFRQTFQAS